MLLDLLCWGWNSLKVQGVKSKEVHEPCLEESAIAAKGVYDEGSGAEEWLNELRKANEDNKMHADARPVSSGSMGLTGALRKAWNYVTSPLSSPTSDKEIETSVRNNPANKADAQQIEVQSGIASTSDQPYTIDIPPLGAHLVSNDNTAAQ